MKRAAALDTNILSSLLLGSTDAAERILNVRTLMPLVLCPATYAELFATPGTSQEILDRLLVASRISVVPMTEASWLVAGERFSTYAARRRKSGGGFPRRLLADFIIGAHAFLEARAVVTEDRGFFATNFPELELL